ncbi:hypothetical protein SHO565_51940 [Streptomyces sp. HO565]
MHEPFGLGHGAVHELAHPVPPGFQGGPPRGTCGIGQSNACTNCISALRSASCAAVLTAFLLDGEPSIPTATDCDTIVLLLRDDQWKLTGAAGAAP